MLPLDCPTLINDKFHCPCPPSLALYAKRSRQWLKGIEGQDSLHVSHVK